MNQLEVGRKRQQFRGQYGYGYKKTGWVCLQNTSDYSPFGVALDGRTIQDGFYRRGFNGMEMDDEVSGGGNSLDFGNRMYNPRLGRFLSTDKFEHTFANQSPYVFAGNTPIWANDVNGDSVVFYSESGKYLMTSYDNERYKGQNFLVVIKDKDVANFREQASKKMDAEIPKAREKAGTGRQYTEALLAGLKDMGTSYKIKNVKEAKKLATVMKLENEIKNEKIKIKALEEENDRLDDQMNEKREQIGSPDGMDPKVGNEGAKLIATRHLIKQYIVNENEKVRRVEKLQGLRKELKKVKKT